MPRTTTNLEKLDAFVAGHLRIAAGKSPAAARDHLLAWATHLNHYLTLIGGNDVPDHLVGLTAFDIANARDRLIAGAGRKVAA